MKVLAGTREDLKRACNVWENTQHQQNDTSEVEGVLYNNECSLDVIDGHYDEEKHWTRRHLIGRGGFCNIYLCQDLKTDAFFCLKKVCLLVTFIITNRIMFISSFTILIF
jgi:hypothetical protein